MNTTLLFAELLIIGLQASLWLLALTLIVLGDGWLQSIQFTSLANWQTIAIVILLPFFYVLGILIDRVADSIFVRWDMRIRNQLIPNRPHPMNVIRFQLGLDNEYLNRHIEYMRTRIRIARASSINFVLATLFIVLFIQFRLQKLSAVEKWPISLFMLMLGIALTVLAIYAWYKLTTGYYHVINANYELLQSKRQKDEHSSKIDHKQTEKKNRE